MLVIWGYHKTPPGETPEPPFDSYKEEKQEKQRLPAFPVLLSAGELVSKLLIEPGNAVRSDIQAIVRVTVGCRRIVEGKGRSFERAEDALQRVGEPDHAITIYGNAGGVRAAVGAGGMIGVLGYAAIRARFRLRYIQATDRRNPSLGPDRIAAAINNDEVGR